MPSRHAASQANAEEVVADAYAGILNEVVAPEYNAEERAMLADPVFYYGRFLDPLQRAYALDTVKGNVSRAIEYLRLPAGRAPRILDLGSGLGMQSIIFARYGADVLGVDLDPRCAPLSEKRRRFFERRWNTSLAAHFVASDFHEFARSHAGEPFDVVFSMSAFAHIPPLSQTVSEISQLLAPRSRVFLWDQNPDFLFMNHWRSNGRAETGLPRPGAIRRALQENGFHLDMFTGGSAIPRQFWRWPATYGAVAAANRVLRRQMRLSFSYVVAAHRGAE